MRTEQWQTWQDAFDAEWRDEVDPPAADDNAECAVLRDFVDDAKDFAKTVADVTFTPLRMMAAALPDVVASEHRHWRRARRRWARARRANW
jgi:hypothetical protein